MWPERAFIFEANDRKMQSIFNTLKLSRLQDAEAMQIFVAM